MPKFKKKIKQFPYVQELLAGFRTLAVKHSIFEKIGLLSSFYMELAAYKKLGKNPDFNMRRENLKPMIFERLSETIVDPTYFYQDAWCAGKIFQASPDHHVDVGSETGFVGIVSQFVPTTMVDIRPVNLSMPGFSFVKGDILAMPFPDNSVSSLSSICVVEHIGLGRFGDSLDPFGSEKSAKELSRILAPGGNLYISLPVDTESRIYFNAHRAFTRDHALRLFPSLELAEEKYIYGRNIVESYDPTSGFGTGMYHFKKSKDPRP
ncbi:MAG: hypothetical protein JWN89_736 [Parcubacteria group bacterium]|nr:hypothetical protein [Parcubacteria group bacterium]